jgi:type I restriction enzyme S subunit
MATEESLPLGWEWKRLVDVADVARGKFTHRPRNDPKFYGGEIPFVQTSDVVNSPKYLRGHSQTLSQLGLTVSRMFSENTVLMVIAGSVGATAITKYAVAFPDSIVGITPKHGYSPEFIHHAIKSRTSHLNDIATESAQANLSLELIAMFKLATPTPAVANRIAYFLDTIDGTIEATRAVIEQTRKLKSALLQELLINNQKKSPKSWELTAIRDLIDPSRDLCYGVIQPGEHVSNGVPMVRVCDIENGQLDPTQLKRIDPFIALQYARSQLQGGELLVTLVGTIGRCTVAPATAVGFNVARAVAVAPLKSTVNTRFVMHTLNSVANSLLDSGAFESARKTLNLSEFAQIQIAIPDRRQQNEITEAVDAIELREHGDLQVLDRLSRMKTSLSHALFTGQIALNSGVAELQDVGNIDRKLEEDD